MKATTKDDFLLNLAQKDIAREKSLQEVIGLPDTEIEKIYAFAGRLYEDKRFQDASDVFFLLTLLKPNQYAFWVGLGLADQQLEGYRQALESYGYAMFLDLDDPQAHLYAAQCFYHLNEFDKAKDCLNFILSLKEVDPKFLPIVHNLKALMGG